MSRGLGKLQRFIKEQVYRVGREWNERCAALEAAGSNEDTEGTFYLTWPHIRHLIEENPELNPGPYRISRTLERSAKRALYLLVKRGEIAKIPKFRDTDLTGYVTIETFQETFSSEAMEDLRKGFARMGQDDPSEWH